MLFVTPVAYQDKCTVSDKPCMLLILLGINRKKIKQIDRISALRLRKQCCKYIVVNLFFHQYQTANLRHCKDNIYSNKHQYIGLSLL